MSSCRASWKVIPRYEKGVSCWKDGQSMGLTFVVGLCQRVLCLNLSVVFAVVELPDDAWLGVFFRFLTSRYVQAWNLPQTVLLKRLYAKNQLGKFLVYSSRHWNAIIFFERLEGWVRDDKESRSAFPFLLTYLVTLMLQPGRFSRMAATCGPVPSFRPSLWLQKVFQNQVTLPSGSCNMASLINKHD